MSVTLSGSAILCVAALLSLPVCASAQVDIQWGTLARNFRGRSEAIPVRCPPGGRAANIWGTDTYTDDSSICTAAVHAGLITFQDGGIVVLQLSPGLESYRGSRRNGVATQPYGEWEASFYVTEYVPPPEPEPPPPAPPPPGPPTIGWERTAKGLAPNGRRFTFVCRPRGTPATVMGGELYSWDSSICTAAVHAGAITLAKGGNVTIEMRPGARSYAASSRNGIETMSGGGTILGFTVMVDERGR